MNYNTECYITLGVRTEAVVSSKTSPSVVLPQERLPDWLRAGLEVVCVETAAGRYSASVGAYYARPGNRFWETLLKAGLTPRRYEPGEFGELLPLGIGFTDMSKVGVGMDRDVRADQYDVAGFESKIRRYKPRTVAFTSKKAASVWLEIPTGRITLGRQEDQQPVFPQVFVLSSPSGAAGRHWTLKPWQELAEWVKGGRNR